VSLSPLVPIAYAPPGQRRARVTRWSPLLCAVAVLASGPSCARYGFEDLGLPRVDAGLDGPLVNAGNGQPDAAGSGVDSTLPDGSVAPATPRDAGIDGSVPAPELCSWNEPERLGSPNYPGNDLWSPSLASDGLSLYFALLVPGGVEQVALSTRSDRGVAFGDGLPLPPPINLDTEGTPNLSADGLSLYFFSERAGGAGGRDLYVATRSSTSAEFETVRELSALNTPDREHLPRVSSDDLTLYFVSNRTGDTDIWRATRTSPAADFADPVLVPELNSGNEDGAVTLSPDGLEAILSSNRPSTLGGRDLYRATRASTSQPFAVPEPLLLLNSTVNDYDPTLSFDGAELYFVSNRRGSNTEVYRSLRSCPP
jgi:hypothetical protein